QEVLAPGMQDGGDADLCAEMFRIGRQGQQGLCRCLKQQIVQPPLVVADQWVETVWEGEDQKEGLDRGQTFPGKFGPLGPLGCLALGAVPIAAGVVGNAGIATTLASFHMATQGSGTTGSQAAHDGRLLGGQRMALAVVSPMSAKDVRHLEAWTGR